MSDEEIYLIVGIVGGVLGVAGLVVGLLVQFNVIVINSSRESKLLQSSKVSSKVQNSDLGINFTEDLVA